MHSPPDIKQEKHSLDVKTDVSGLYKNLESGAVINKDNDALLAYKQQKKRNQKFNNMEKDVNQLKDDITTIKSMLIQLLEKNN